MGSVLSIFLLMFLLPLVQDNQQGRSKNRAEPERPSPTESGNESTAPLLETGSAANLRSDVKPVAEVKVLSYNIRWRGGDDLLKLIQLFRDDREIGNASLMALQEVDRQKKRTKNINTVKQIADALGVYYAWAAPPPANGGKEEETGVALLSIYPLSDIHRIVLPNKGPNQRRRVALGATVRLSGIATRVYSVHSETRIPLDKKLQQMEAVLEDLSQYPKTMPVIILGDLNTWEVNAGKRTTKLFTDAGFRTPFGNQTTFFRRVFFLPIELRLDWVWLRGLEPKDHGIDRAISISDHFPLWTTLRLPTASQ